MPGPSETTSDGLEVFHDANALADDLDWEAMLMEIENQSLPSGPPTTTAPATTGSPVTRGVGRTIEKPIPQAKVHSTALDELELVDNEPFFSISPVPSVGISSPPPPLPPLPSSLRALIEKDLEMPAFNTHHHLPLGRILNTEIATNPSRPIALNSTTERGPMEPSERSITPVPGGSLRDSRPDDQDGQHRCDHLGCKRIFGNANQLK
jgi:hypothetical protein